MALFGNEKSPMDFVYEKYVKIDSNELVSGKRYLQFLLDNKLSGDKEALHRLLSSEDSLLRYHEAIAKGLISYYSDDKDKGMYRLLKMYDRSNSQLKNSFEGFFVSDILMKERMYSEANKLIDNIEFCMIQANNIDSLACLSSQVALNCIIGEDYLNDLHIILAKDKEVAQYVLNYCQSKK